MPNTVKKSGNDDIRTLVKKARSKAACEVLELLHVHNEPTHQRAVELMGLLMDEIGDDPAHALNTFMDLLTDAIERYERAALPAQKATPVEVLKYLMESHSLAQSDLANELGGQSVVSEILRGSRQLNLRQIRALAERFNTNPSVFI
jgi:HTH-type transcriptional regulator/antitoxin HigA